MGVFKNNNDWITKIFFGYLILLFIVIIVITVVWWDDIFNIA